MMRKRFFCQLIFGMAILFFVMSFSGIGWAVDIDAGQKTFKVFCARCHGIGGKGDGKVANRLKLKMPNLTDKKQMAKVSVKSMEEIIRKGGKPLGKNPKMISYAKKLSEKQIQDVIAYIQTLSP